MNQDLNAENNITTNSDITYPFTPDFIRSVVETADRMMESVSEGTSIDRYYEIVAEVINNKYKK